jgi:hypothetical protein
MLARLDMGTQLARDIVKPDDNVGRVVVFAVTAV